MAQLTLYLDDATEQLMEEAISASGVSRSRWGAELIREKLAQQWPEEVLAHFKLSTPSHARPGARR